MDKSKVKSQLRDRLAKAKQSIRLSQPGQKEAYYGGKAAAYREAIKLIEELEA